MTLPRLPCGWWWPCSATMGSSLDSGDSRCRFPRQLGGRVEMLIASTLYMEGPSFSKLGLAWCKRERWRLGRKQNLKRNEELGARRWTLTVIFIFLEGLGSGKVKSVPLQVLGWQVAFVLAERNTAFITPYSLRFLSHDAPPGVEDQGE